MSKRIAPADAAAIAVGATVLLLPIGLSLAGAWASLSSPNLTPPPRTVTTALAVFLAEAGTLSLFASPLVVLAAVRARRHADRYLGGTSAGWRGVLEAGAVGLFVGVLPLTRGILTRPLDSPPYIAAYGGAGLVIGLLYGLVLRTVAIAVLTLTRGDRPGA